MSEPEYESDLMDERDAVINDLRSQLAAVTAQRDAALEACRWTILVCAHCGDDGIYAKNECPFCQRHRAAVALTLEAAASIVAERDRLRVASEFALGAFGGKKVDLRNPTARDLIEFDAILDLTHALASPAADRDCESSPQSAS